MNKKAKLIKTDSYYNIFPLLIDELKNLDSKNSQVMIFCEEKISLMTERYVCDKLNGGFNIGILSFGKFLRKNKEYDNVLSKEGSAMVVKRVLQSAKLNCFSAGRNNLASTLFELIIQLKSAKISPSAISSECIEDGILKNKIKDISLVYTEYENFLKKEGYVDQNSLLDDLPEAINKDLQIENTEVILLGYTGWTRQAREGIRALLNRAKKVTAILTSGKNEQIYLNETSLAFQSICAEQKVELEERFIPTNMNSESRIISDYLFRPSAFKRERYVTDKISLYSVDSREEEIRNLAVSIKKSVMKEGLRYKDIVVALPDFSIYEDLIESYFSVYEIPFFSDSKKKIENHPLVNLIVSYIEVFRKGFDRKILTGFFKNPLFNDDKDFTDKFENYLIRYNINYSGIKKPFTYFSEEDDPIRLEKFRSEICSYFEKFNLIRLIESLKVEDKLQSFSQRLLEKGEAQLCSVNSQVYDAVLSILEEMQMILGDINFSREDLREIETIFLSGISALEISILPQFNDAVFVGGYRETALSCSKKLFMIGLDSSVPSIKEDVALLSDRDINRLSEIKILIEPKIKIVNERAKENFALSTLSFEQNLYLSYPINVDGSKVARKSEMLSYLEALFTIKKFDVFGFRTFSEGVEIGDSGRYLTRKTGLLSFAEDCGRFAEGEVKAVSDGAEQNEYDFTSYYMATENLPERDEAEQILNQANKELKIRLEDNNDYVIGKYISPTTLETFHSCPYRAFISNVLNVNEREDGTFSALTVGNMMHEIFENYVKGFSQITDESSSELLINNCIEEVLKRNEYKKFTEEKQSGYALKTALNEARSFCQKTYKMLNNSSFKPFKTEAIIGSGEGSDFPPVMLDKDIFLIGKIDRVDKYKDYYRIFDYKTGLIDTDDTNVFVGKRLQLFLYASALKEGKLAGVYYIPISDEYKKEDESARSMAVGHSLDNEEVLLAQDKTIKEEKSQYIPVKYNSSKENFSNVLSEKTMEAYVKYALKISRNASKKMRSGVIIPSPYDRTCDYCKFIGLCGGSVGTRPKISADETLIENSAEVNDDDN